MDTPKTPIEVACDLMGSQAAMARILGVTPAMVNQLTKGHRPVPIEHCLAIESATNGKVKREELRPADFWRIWPDLAHLAPTPPKADTEDPNGIERRHHNVAQNPDLERREPLAAKLAGPVD